MIKNERFPGADGIRGLACLVVLLTHAAAMFFITAVGPRLAGAGKIGVWLFFVLSAFLLTHKFQTSGFSVSALGSYALGRVIRILPLFFVAVLVYFLLGTAGIDSARDVWLAVSFQNGYAHLWTIPVEFTFYAWLPLIAAALIAARKQSIAVASVTAIIFIVGQQALWPYWRTEMNGIGTKWYLSSFTMGCYLATVINDVRGRVSDRSSDVICTLVAAGLILGTTGARHAIFGMPFDTALSDKFVYISAAWVLFIIATIDIKGIFGRLVNSKVMQKLGTWSYSIYLFHWLVFMHLQTRFQNSIVAMLAAIGISILVGAAIYHLLELPLERIRHRLQGRFLARGDEQTKDPLQKKQQMNA
ncbi:acyltransferase family protein [Achromobacter animicus]|uniref:acyltransferase family protein n=1 Tax=Achromobacter animicus TaxID=1389935 RepID=UPI0028A59166|nr:acyltransferase [Achromobacter animicus]